jgi:hypothetical protein
MRSSSRYELFLCRFGRSWDSSRGIARSLGGAAWSVFRVSATGDAEPSAEEQPGSHCFTATQVAVTTTPSHTRLPSLRGEQGRVRLSGTILMQRPGTTRLARLGAGHPGASADRIAMMITSKVFLGCCLAELWRRLRKQMHTSKVLHQSTSDALARVATPLPHAPRFGGKNRSANRRDLRSFARSPCVLTLLFRSAALSRSAARVSRPEAGASSIPRPTPMPAPARRLVARASQSLVSRDAAGVLARWSAGSSYFRRMKALTSSVCSLRRSLIACQTRPLVASKPNFRPSLSHSFAGCRLLNARMAQSPQSRFTRHL